MLRQRIITALILLPLVLALIFMAPSIVFAIVIGAVVVIAAWEWSMLSGLNSLAARSLYSGVIAAAMAACWMYSISLPAIAVYGFWLFAFVLVISYPKTSALWGNTPVKMLIGLFVLLSAWMAVVKMQALDDGAWKLLYAMALVWGADTGAYFAGKRFGKRKLAPKVSPGKSIAGFVGGVVTTLLLAVIVLLAIDYPSNAWISFLLVTFVSVLASVLGDLFESMLKRQRGVKDSGTILPGHGGILDRIDSITAAVPVFCVSMTWTLW